ncbi:MAG: hypothetical protein IKH75_12505 [Ruminococcus sp.]|nr:hypothetical protein [Ruminococcus sp.]
MQRLTHAQEEKLAELLDRKEKMVQHDKAFFKEVCKRREEVLNALEAEDLASNSFNQEQKEIVDTVHSVAEKLGCDIPTLLKMIKENQQIEYWSRQLNYRYFF